MVSSVFVYNHSFFIEIHKINNDKLGNPVHFEMFSDSLILYITFALYLKIIWRKFQQFNAIICFTSCSLSKQLFHCIIKWFAESFSCENISINNVFRSDDEKCFRSIYRISNTFQRLIIYHVKSWNIFKESEKIQYTLKPLFMWRKFQLWKNFNK